MDDANQASTEEQAPGGAAGDVNPDVTPDDAATQILGNDGEQHGAVKFEGWLAGPEDSAPGLLRLYTCPSFLEWLQISPGDILGQVKGTLGRPAGGSTIWVRRGAGVRRVQAGVAEHFEDLVEGSSGDDPAAARWPPRGY
jgi:hypothetical protein